MTADELIRLRAQMDAINLQLRSVLQQRAALCRQIGAWKRRTGAPPADLAREAAMLSELAANPGPGFDRAALQRIFACVFAESRALVERAMRGDAD